MMRLPVSVVLLFSTCSLAAQDPQDWPQWRGPARDGTWRENGLMKELPAELEIRWRAPVAGGYSGPTVAAGRVYVTDRVVEPAEVERVHCFAWDTGERLWTHEYPCVYTKVGYEAGPRCSVLVDRGRAYSLGTMGHLFCLDAASGEVRWSADLDAKYSIQMPVWGIAASPLIEGELLIVPASGADGYLVGFDAATGEERWKALDDGGNYSAPIVVDQAGRRVVVCWTAKRIVGVDAANGELHWEFPFKARRMPLGVASPVPAGRDLLFFTGFYDGCLMLRLDLHEMGVEEVWRKRGQNEVKTSGLHSIISTPLVRGDHIYGVDSYGQLRCLSVADGERVWEDLTAVPKARWATIHFVQNGERTWMFNERGELIIAELSPEGFRELSRAKLIRPTRGQLNQRGGVCWSHPAFAYQHVFARNDEELVCADLSAQ